MDIDFNAHPGGDFPIGRPMDALRTDHELARQLFDRYFQSSDMAEKKELGQHAMTLLEMHTSLEEEVLYPRVRQVDASLIQHCEQEHEEAKQLIEQLKVLMQGDPDPQADQVFRRLADAVLAHVQEEEQQLFPKVEQAGLDMSAIGQEMQQAQLRMIAARNQKPVAPGLRV